MQRTNVPLEAQEQKALFEWAHYAKGNHPELALLFAIPNGGKRDQIEARHLKEQGVKPGVPDLFLPVARGPFHGLFIELKRQQGGRISDSQRRWLDMLTTAGYYATVAHGWREATAILTEYLDMI